MGERSMPHKINVIDNIVLIIYTVKMGLLK